MSNQPVEPMVIFALLALSSSFAAWIIYTIIVHSRRLQEPDRLLDTEEAERWWDTLGGDVPPEVLADVQGTINGMEVHRYPDDTIVQIRPGTQPSAIGDGPFVYVLPMDTYGLVHLLWPDGDEATAWLDVNILAEVREIPLDQTPYVAFFFDSDMLGSFRIRRKQLKEEGHGGRHRE